MQAFPSDEMSISSDRRKRYLPLVPLLRITEYSACFIVALPTAVLNSLAAVSTGDSSRVRNLQNPEDLKRLIIGADTGAIFYGIVALTASEAVLFFMNKRYFLGSAKASLDLMRRSFITLKNKLTRQEIEPETRASFSENILFTWSLLTSLIFAEMGRKSLSFLGVPGEAIGFSLNLLVYFATRFAGANMFFSTLGNRNSKLKQWYATRIELLDESKVDFQEVLIENSQSAKNHALVNFLKQVDERWETLPKNKARIAGLRYIAPFVGWSLVGLTSIPIMSSFIPEAVRGAEVLTHSQIGADRNYQNTSSFLFGIFAVVLTLFFYELNIKEMPKQFIYTTLGAYEKLKSRELRDAAELTGLTCLAGTASYFSGLGFKFIADNALSQEYLSYLGEGVGNAVPQLLLAAVILMLWSHLQTLINHPLSPKTEDFASITSIDVNNARALLCDPQTDIAAIERNDALLFNETSLNGNNTATEDNAWENC